MDALNIVTTRFDRIAHHERDRDQYTLHTPHKGPFQEDWHRSRCLWEHTTSKYIVWSQKGCWLVLYPDADWSPEEIGETINDMLWTRPCTLK